MSRLHLNNPHRAMEYNETHTAISLQAGSAYQLTFRRRCVYATDGESMINYSRLLRMAAKYSLSISVSFSWDKPLLSAYCVPGAVRGAERTVMIVGYSASLTFEWIGLDSLSQGSAKRGLWSMENGISLLGHLFFFLEMIGKTKSPWSLIPGILKENCQKWDFFGSYRI